MPSNSDFIPITLRLENEQYKAFHQIVERKGGCKTKVLRLLVKQYIELEIKASTRQAR